jgi:prepilin-type N-terminal cleavage/methylation domain-containing protein
MRTTRPSTIEVGRLGFTLVELSLVLVIMGLIGFFVFGPVMNLIGKEKLRDGQDALQKVADRLTGRVAGYYRLPDPDPGGVAPAGYGQPDPWGRPVLYWLAPQLAGGGRISSVGGTTLVLRTYRTVGSGGPFPAADAQLLSEVGNLAFILASTGPDLAQEITVTTAEGKTMINVLRGGPMSDGSGREFDDLVRAVSLGELKALVAK